MTYNLIRERWLPMRTRSGANRWIRPAEIATDLNRDPVIAPDWPRGDFNTATYELLIGLLYAAYPPETHEEWAEVYHSPPSVETLEAALTNIAPAFDLDGDGPRFCQELGGLEGAPRSIESLLIDSPGENGQKKNADLLTHRDRYPALSKPAAAMALYTLQTYAPSGGAGIMTSLRGGGPLTTIVLPEDDGGEPPLWRTLWANVALGARPDPADHPKVFPWLAPRIETGKSARLHQQDSRAHPLQAFFGAPRRLQLALTDAPIDCPLLGDRFEGGATGVIQRPGGVGYGLWMHPLTPYRRQKEADEPYTAKPKPGAFGYRDWVAAVVGDATRKRQEPALNVSAARTPERIRVIANRRRRARIRLAGWAMNNMEAQAYLVAEEPFHLAGDPVFAADLDRTAREYAQAGERVHGLLRNAIKSALYPTADERREKIDTDKGVFETARLDYFDATDGPFHDLLDRAATTPGDAYWDERQTRSRDWLKALRRAALKTFDEAVPLLRADPVKAKPIVKARGVLRSTLLDFGKLGGPLFDLAGAPKPDTKSQTTEDPA